MASLLTARSPDVARLTKELEDLMRRQAENPDGNCYLIVNAGDPYVQFVSDPEGKNVSFEAIANEFLPPERRLDQERIAALVALGFEPPEATGVNFLTYRDLVEDGDFADVAAMSILVLFEIYGTPLDEPLTYERES